MMNTMPVSEVIEKVADVCKKNGVQRLDLFGFICYRNADTDPVILILLFMDVKTC